MKLNITPYHFEELNKKGYSLDLIYLLKLVEQQFDIVPLCTESIKIDILRMTLKRKGLLIDTNELTLSGKDLLAFMETKETTKLVKKKPISSDFEEWWKTFPGTDTFVYKSAKFTGCRSLRTAKEECRLKFDKILNEGEYSAQQLIDSLAYDIQQKKEKSFKEKSNKITYLQNSLTYLNQRSFEPFIELLIQNTEIKLETSFGGTDV